METDEAKKRADDALSAFDAAQAAWMAAVETKDQALIGPAFREREAARRAYAEASFALNEAKRAETGASRLGAA